MIYTNLMTLKAVMVVFITMLMLSLFQAIGVHMVMCVFLAAPLLDKVLLFPALSRGVPTPLFLAKANDETEIPIPLMTVPLVVVAKALATETVLYIVLGASVAKLTLFATLLVVALLLLLLLKVVVEHAAPTL